MVTKKFFVLLVYHVQTKHEASSRTLHKCQKRLVSLVPYILKLSKTKNQYSKSDMFVTQVCLNPFPNKPWFLHVCSTSLLKTLWKKEKLLLTSNLSYSHSVFYPFGRLSAISSNLKLLSANSLSLNESKVCRLGKG